MSQVLPLHTSTHLAISEPTHMLSKNHGYNNYLLLKALQFAVKLFALLGLMKGKGSGGNYMATVVLKAGWSRPGLSPEWLESARTWWDTGFLAAGFPKAQCPSEREIIYWLSNDIKEQPNKNFRHSIRSPDCYSGLRPNRSCPLSEEEQKALRKERRGCQDALWVHKLVCVFKPLYLCRIIDNVNMDKARINWRNLSTVWFDYQKAYDMVPHQWVDILKAVWAPKIARRALEMMMLLWDTTVELKGSEGKIGIPCEFCQYSNRLIHTSMTQIWQLFLNIFTNTNVHCAFVHSVIAI